MRPNQVTPAIVLRSRPFGESDKIVSFITENYGKLTGIAKGALRSRKRFVNSLEPFALVNLRFHDRPHSNLAFVLSADLQRAFRRLSVSLDRISYASYLVEITNGLIGEREENPAVFQHLREGLAYIEENGTSLRFLTFFELKLLRLVGYQPTFENCKRCRREHPSAAALHWHFSPSAGGILCGSCARAVDESLQLSPTALEVLVALQMENTAPTSRVSWLTSVIKEIRSARLRFIEYHVAREMKTVHFLYQFASIHSD